VSTAPRSLAVSALLAALLLAGCGGGEDSESTTSKTTTASKQAGTTTGSHERESPAKAPAPTPPNPDPPVATERVPGSKAVAPDVPVTEGGDNSVQAFGTEGEEDQAAQATATLGAYLGARADKDWAAACKEASAQLIEELARLVERAKAKGDAEKPKGCAETLALLSGEASEAALEEAAVIEQVLSFRIRDDGYAYLIYKGAQGKVKFIAMADDDGTWKVNTVEPSAFEGPPGEAR
jgi:hypothetical protein